MYGLSGIKLISPLRKARLAKKLNLENLSCLLCDSGESKSAPTLSLIERGIVWPSKKTVETIVKVFNGEVTEMEILFPEQFTGEKEDE